MTEYNLKYLKSEDAKKEIQSHFRDYHRTKPLEVLTIANGVILPAKEADKALHPYTWMGVGGVLDANGSFVRMSGIKHVLQDALCFGGKYDYEEPAEELDETVIYMGPFQPHWGHFIVDYCTRLWYCLNDEHNYRIAYCGFNCKEGELQKAYEEFMELLQIRREQLIDIRKPTKFKEIIVPEQAFLNNQYFTDEFRKMIDFAYKNVKTDHLIPYEKIYSSRVEFIKKNGKLRENGEKEVQDTFEKNGYKILFPETLSVGEQIFYIRNCKEFVGMACSNSANVVFASKNCKFVYLRKAFEIVYETLQINQMVEAEQVTFIDCYYKPYKGFPLAFGQGPHLIGVTKELMQYLSDNNFDKLSSGIYRAALVKSYLWLTKVAIRMTLSSWVKSIIHFR